MLTSATIIIFGLIIIILGIFVYRGLRNIKLYKLLLPEVGTIIFIIVSLLIANCLGLLLNISLNIKPLNEETGLGIVEGITTAYVFFGMASFTEKKGFDVWVVLLSTKIFPIFFTIAVYIMILLLWVVSDLTIIFFVTIIIFLLVTGLIQTINIGLYPSLYKDFEKKFKKRLYTDSLNKQKDYKSAISSFLNFVFNSKVYNLSPFSSTKESKTICFLLNKEEDVDLLHFNPEEFKKFLQQAEKLMNNYSISLYKNTQNKTINLEEGKSNSFNFAVVRLLYPYQKNNYLIEISIEDDIDIPKISSAQKWNLERILRRAFRFSKVVSKSTSVGVTDINSLFEQYIKAIKDENSIIMESINEQILLYYTGFWDFLTMENYQYTMKEANAESDIFSEAFAWRELAQLFNNTYKSFCLSSISKDPFVKKAGRELPLRILYQSHKRQDILTFSKIASWYFTREYHSIIESGDITDIRSLLLNLKELFYPYSDYLHKYFDFQKEVQTILLNQYLILARISIEKSLPENLDAILEHLFNITDFSDEVEDIDISLYRETDEDNIQKIKKIKSYFLSLNTKASQIIFCLSGWVLKNNLDENIKKVLSKYLPKTDNQLLKLYLDEDRESLGVEFWDIEPEIGKNLTVKDIGMDFYDKRIFLEQFLHISYQEDSLKFEDIRFEEQKLSYATYIFKLDEIIKSLETETFSYMTYGYATNEAFEEFKNSKRRLLTRLVEEIKHIEQSEIGEKEISLSNRKILYDEFHKSYKKLIMEPISLNYFFRNILKKEILFEEGQILSSNHAFGFNQLLNKDNFFDDEVQYLHELGESFAEGFVEGETNQFIKEISKYATEIDLKQITPSFIKSKDFILIATRAALYKLHLQKNPSIEFIYDGNNLISGKMKVGKTKINIYELDAKDDKFLLLNTSTVGIIKRIEKSGKKGLERIFDYSLAFLSENETLTKKFLEDPPQWLLEKDMSNEEKLLYLKTMAIIKIYERLKFENFEEIECYNIKLDADD